MRSTNTSMPVAKLPATPRKPTILRRIVRYMLLVCGSSLFLGPFLWMVSTSLKPDAQVFIYPPQWIPRPFEWSNYVKAWTAAPFGLYLKNSCVITFGSILGTIIACPLVGYSFARLRWAGRNIWFIVMLATAMLPSQVTMIPVYILFKRLGWIDTFLPLIVPSFLPGLGAGYIFLARQYFLTVPLEISHAARIDGCSELGIYRRVILPLAKPVVVSLAIFEFSSKWNDFMGPLIYLNSEAKKNLPLGLFTFQGVYSTSWPELMAITVLMAIPVVLIFFFLQRYFIEGINLSGVQL